MLLGWGSFTKHNRMKRFFLICLLLSLGNLRAEDSATPPPKEEIIGKWQGYILNHGEITFLSPVVYHFLPDGTWEILEGEKAAAPQGWYKLDHDALFLQPLQAAQKNENAGVKALRKGKDTFEIPDTIDKDRSIIFLRKESAGDIRKDDVVGAWKMSQKDLSTGETREAPFLLQFGSDGTYKVIPQGKTSLSEEWASGTFEISGQRLFLKNKFTGEGLWNKPSFFLLDGKLRYNNGEYCLWCERVPNEGEPIKE